MRLFNDSFYFLWVRPFNDSCHALVLFSYTFACQHVQVMGNLSSVLSLYNTGFELLPLTTWKYTMEVQNQSSTLTPRLKNKTSRIWYQKVINDKEESKIFNLHGCHHDQPVESH